MNEREFIARVEYGDHAQVATDGSMFYSSGRITLERRKPGRSRIVIESSEMLLEMLSTKLGLPVLDVPEDAYLARLVHVEDRVTRLESWQRKSFP